MQKILRELFTNQIFNAALFSWLMAQFIKTVINLVIFRERKKRDRVQASKDLNIFQNIFSEFLWKTGGMPSSHSSMVTAMTTALAIEEGVNSPTFLVSFGFSSIVVRDAVGVRRTVGILSKKFNELAQKYNATNENKVIDMVKVVEGHSMSEVFVGIFLGFFVAQCVYLF